MTWTLFWTLIGVHLLGCMSPGPDFIVVMKNSISYDRRAGIFTALGVSLGILFHTSYCALGLGVLLLEIPQAFWILKVVGGCYLSYLGLKIFLSPAIIPVLHYRPSKRSYSAWSALRLGFTTNALNPKAMLFIMGLFILIAKLRQPWWSLFFVVEMVLMTLVWFIFVGYCFSHAGLKARLVTMQVWISRGLAILLWLFALQLLFARGGP